MEPITKKFYLRHIDEALNGTIKKRLAGKKNSPFTRCYTQSEEFFLKLDRPFKVPSLPVHHDVEKHIPEAGYAKKIREFILSAAEALPELFDGLTYIFDPEDIHGIKFFKLYKIERTSYLYVLRLDLLFRDGYSRIITQGSNDTTPAYETEALFLEAFFVPALKSRENETECIKVRETLNETWLEEKGRGYFVQGVWMDNELSKFFTKLFLPEGKSLYPFYPFVCKYKTVCQNILDFTPGGRKAALPYLHRALRFLSPKMDDIQRALRDTSFSNELKIFKTLKAGLPSYWQNTWKKVISEGYLNANDMREFTIEIQD